MNQNLINKNLYTLQKDNRHKSYENVTSCLSLYIIDQISDTYHSQQYTSSSMQVSFIIFL